MSFFDFVQNEQDSYERLTKCESCGKNFIYSVTDYSMSGCHDWEPIWCPWCHAQNGEVSGGDMISVDTFKVENGKKV